MICPRCHNQHSGAGKLCEYCAQVMKPDRSQSSDETRALDAYTEQLKDDLQANDGGWIE